MVDHDAHVSAWLDFESVVELARQALTTPSVDAEGAFVVLVDALLERGWIRSKSRHFRSSDADALTRWSALEWAREQVGILL